MKKLIAALALGLPTLCFALSTQAATAAEGMPHAPDAGDMSFIGYMVIGLSIVATIANRKR